MLIVGVTLTLTYFLADINQLAVDLVSEIGRRISSVTKDTRETMFLFQRLSAAL